MKKIELQISGEKEEETKHEMNHIFNKGIVKSLLDKYKPSRKLRIVKNRDEEVENEIAA